MRDLSDPARHQALAEAIREAARRRRLLGLAPLPLYHLPTEDGRIVPYHEGQRRAWDSQARFVFVFAGTQGGKTQFGPRWLDREITLRGRGDYLAATSTFDLFKLKMLPAIRQWFEQHRRIGRYWSGAKVIELCDPSTLRFYARNADDPMWGRIILRSAQSEGGLEAATAKAAWLDECGQDEFGVDAWEGVVRRLSIHQGRVLGTTTLYNRGWLKSQVYDKWLAGDKSIDIIQFASTSNPAFPQEEYDRIVATLPAWKVAMFYKGEFDIPEGLIYGPFDSVRHTCEPFEVPAEWPRYAGLDFGGVHTAATLWAERPADKHLFCTREYLHGERTTRQHSVELMGWSARRWFGGAGSEDQWRLEFGAVGMPVLKPLTSDVEVGIDTVYSQVVTDGITIFRSCTHLLDEFGSYSRALGKDGQPTDKIADKERYHLLDSVRYVLGSIRKSAGKAKVVKLD